MHCDDEVFLDAGAAAGDFAGEVAGAFELGEVLGAGVPEVAGVPSAVVRVGGVDAGLISRASVPPCGDVVAPFDFKGGEFFVVIAGRGDGNDFGLGPLLALIEPDGTCEDGQSVGLADVDGLGGLWMGV